MRPYHAGLLGVDTLVALDEAHLVPSFEKLLEAIAVASVVTFLLQPPYTVGECRAAMIEGPSREAIELVEIPNP